MVIDGDLPDDFNMLDKTYASVKDCFCDLEEDFENSNAENEGVNENREKGGKEKEEEEEEEEEEYKEENFEGEEEREGSDRRGNAQKWKISKSVGGKTTFIHIKQALKLLLPREYIARCRQKRHWAAKYLQGKAPLDPKHDIIKFDIVRVEAIQTCKDGADVSSFQLNGDLSIRVRFSV